MTPRHRDLLLVACGAALLFLPGLGRHDLWNPDEARYAQVASEMIAGGQLLVPRLNGEVYTEKPPLFFWAIVAAATPAGRVTETAARLPSALAGIAAVLLTFLLAERFFGRRAAWLAAAAYATCGKTLWQARFGQIDMLLGALVVAAVWSWAAARTEGRSSSPLFFLFAGLATLAKGPVGLLPPLLGILLHLAWSRDREGLARLRPGRGLLLWAAVVAVWLVPATVVAGPGYLETLVVDQSLGRYADPWHHHQPWHYYLTVVPAELFPWSLVLPAALVAGWRSFRRPGPALAGPVVTGPADPAARARDGWGFALAWALATLVFFSLSPGKRTVYVFSMYPALALLVGAGLDRLAAAWERRPAAGAARPAGRGWLIVPFAGLAALAAVALAALPSAAAQRPEATALGRPVLVALAAVVALLLLAGLAGTVAAVRRRVVPAAAALAAAMGAATLVGAFVVLPAFDVFKSGRRLSAELLARTPPGTPFGIVPHLDSTLLFYSQRRAVPLADGEEVRAYLARPDRAWLFVKRNDFAWLRLDELPLDEVAASTEVEAEGYVLLAESGPAAGRPVPP